MVYTVFNTKIYKILFWERACRQKSLIYLGFGGARIYFVSRKKAPSPAIIRGDKNNSLGVLRGIGG